MQGKILKYGLYSLGIIAVLIGSSIALIGSQPVAMFFNKILSFAYNAGPVTGFDAANIDSELRFYSVIFIFYGGALIQTARNIELHFSRIPVLLAVFFIAGLARMISYLSVGPPHLLFVVLLTVEICLPILLFLCWKTQKPAPVFHKQ